MKTLKTILLLLCAINLSAANRYVSSINGSTSGTGTQGNAYKNLSQLTALAAGDTVFLECGSLFRESISLFAVGNAGANLVFTSYGNGAKPIISGADTVQNWTQDGNKFYATVTGSVGNFFANNKEQVVARTPDEGTYYQLDSAQTTYLKDADLTQPNGYWNGAKICVHTAQWCWEKSSVSNYQNGKVDYSSPLSLAALSKFGYFFYNKDSCLNAAKEWYYDSINSSLYFIPQSGNPNSFLCEVSSRASGILFQNTASYVSISNIRFEKQSNVGIVLGNQSKHVTIYNCEFFGQYNHGIQTRGKYHLIQNCSFEEVDGHGIDMNQGGNAEVSHCTFKNIGQFRNSGIGGQANCSAIAVNFADSCWLHHNVIDSTGYCGISCDGAYCIVECNIASHCMLLNNDGAPFKAFGALSHHSVFRNNIAHDTQGNTEGNFNGTFQTPGFYFDNYVNNNTFENNTCYNISQKGIFQNSGSSNNYILGNVIFGSAVGLDINGGFQVNDTLNGIEVKRNVLCAANSSGYPLRQVDYFNPNGFTQGAHDSNYYFQPYDVTHVVSRPGGGQQNLSLNDWQSFSGQDAHSKNAFANYSTGTMIPELFVNATDNDTTVQLQNLYLDLDSNIVCGSLVLPPYYSRVLINTGLTCVTGISEIENDIQFSVFPNPAHETISVICNDALLNSEMNLFDMSGRKISSQIISNHISEANVSTLASGVYFLRVKNEGKKFVKE